MENELSADVRCPGGLSVLSDRYVAEHLLSLNVISGAEGLVLSPDDAAAVAANRSQALCDTERVEFGTGALDMIVSTFCRSSYISRNNWRDTLSAVVEIFYSAKNETCDLVSDSETVGFLFDAFDGFCAGSLELLSEVALPEFAAHIRNGGSVENFVLSGDL